MTTQISSLLADLRGSHETDEQIRASDLFKSMAQAGFDPAHPIKVRKSDGLLICGYHRTRCAEILGFQPAKVFIDCTDEEALQIAVRDNTYTAQPITMERRKAIARQLYPAHTQQALAGMLGVSQKTISLWLGDLIYTHGINQTHVKTASNPKGAGRPKGTKGKQPSKVSDEQRDRIATKVLDQGKTWKEVTAEEGVSATVLRRSKAYLEGKRDGQADPIIDPTTLSLSAQEKLAAALRQQKAVHEREFQQRLEEGISRWIDETTIASYADEYSKIRSDIEGRTGIMTAANYKLIQRCLHPDNSASAKMRAEAFVLWEKLKYRFCDNTEMPVHFRVMPENSAGFEALRKAAQEARRAKRKGAAVVGR